MTDTTVHFDLDHAENGADPDEAVLTSRQKQLREEFAGRVEEKRLYKRFPARNGTLAAEYKVVSMEIIGTARRQAGEVPANSDLLIGGLQRIMRHDPGHPAANDRGLVDLEQWLEIDAGGPLKLDARFTAEVGLKDGTAREILLALFEDNDAALCKQADDLMEWTFNTTAEELQDFGLTS